jgi:hypothetical protein
MPFRLICRELDSNPVIHAQEAAIVSYATFPFECPDAEEWLRFLVGKNYGAVGRSIVGVEIVDGDAKSE